MKSVCVFCGSRPGDREEYGAAARSLASQIVGRDLELVFGGGAVGLMGALAETALEAGGRVTGIIPRRMMASEPPPPGLGALHVVEDMHQRKAMMTQLSDAFVVLPGGIGTLEELFEMWSGLQLGFHLKPIGIMNVAGFYDTLWRHLRFSADSGFMDKRHLRLVTVENDPGVLLERLAALVDGERRAGAGGG